MESLLEVGQIVNTYGIKGFIKVKPFVDNKEQFKNFTKLYISQNKKIQEFVIEQVQFAKDCVLIKLKGIETIEQAETLRNYYLQVSRKDIPLEEGAHFIVDLLGLEVYTEEEKFLGIVKEVLQPGANDVYVIENEQKKEILLPVIPEVVKKIDIENKKIIVKLMKGLIE